MELEHSLDEQVPKKHRHRKKLLYNSILQQMEFYFSDSNLTKDRFLSQLVQNDPFIDLSVFLKFNKIRKLTGNTQHIAKALKKSELLELSEDETKVRRITPIKVKDNVDDCTIYVETIKPDATHDWLSSIFSEFGSVVYVSIPKYKHSRLNKGFAFVEFKLENEAKQALEHFESIGCKMSPQMAPEDLCSIATYEGDQGGQEPQMNENDVCDDNNKKQKRKHSDNDDCCEEGDEKDHKKLKVNESCVTEGNVENEEGEDKKKKKTKKTKKKPNFKELGLQILSKYEWKKMRNRYLDTQKKKMKQLKQFLNKRKFSSTRLDDYKQKSQNTEPAALSEPKLQFVPGVIVKLNLPEACTEVKKTKGNLKLQSDKIKFVDAQIGSEEVYLRFVDHEGAEKFCGSDFKAEKCLLEGEEEQVYWQKILEMSGAKLKKDRQKQRGRDKLLKKAEKELGKHIRFDDTD